MRGVSALSLALAAATIVYLHNGGRSDALLSSPPDRKIAAQYDTAVGRGVLNAESSVDSLFVQLSQAQTHLNSLTNGMLEQAAKPAKPAGASKLHAFTVQHVRLNADKAIDQAGQNVNRISNALRDAEKKLNARVSLIVDARPADKNKAQAAAASRSPPKDGPPIALAHTPRRSQLAERPSASAGSNGAGDPDSFPSHAAARKRVRSAFNKFFIKKASEQAAAKAEAAKEAAEGTDVTPYEDCKKQGPHGCDINIWVNLKEPNVDHTSLTGHHFLPSLEPLRKAARQRGHLSIDSSHPLSIGYDAPGSKHVDEIGGRRHAATGKRTGRPDKVV